MSQHDFTIANQTASSARTDINNALQALASCNAGSSEPSTTYANMLWYETDTNILKMRNEADSDWISLFYIDQSSNVIKVLDGTYVSNTSGIATALLGTHSDSTWTTGTNTEKRLVAPSQVKSAIESLSPAVGVGQSWSAPTRSVGTVYQNTTGRPIMVHFAPNTNTQFEVSSNGTTWIQIFSVGVDPAESGTSVIIPNGHYYRVPSGGSIRNWSELR